MTDPLQERIARLRWAIPLSFAVLTVLYQLVLASWVHDRYGDPFHYGVEILFYGSAGPLLTFWVLGLIPRWLEERRRAEEQARASDRRLAAITSASADAIFSLDPNGRIEAYNDGAELLFRPNGGGLLGIGLYDALGRGRSGEAELRWLLESAERSGYVRGHETECHVGGRRLTVDLTATRLENDAGNTAGFSLILRDVTARKEREEEIRRLNAGLNELVAERTRQLDEKVDELARANADLRRLDDLRAEFVSLVSHQIRAPLTNMRGAVERMQDDCGAEMRSTCARMLAILNDQTSRLEHLVSGVLNAARLEDGKLEIHAEPVSLVPLAQRAAEHFRARARGRPLIVQEAQGLPEAFADPERTEEVLANLLDNADKYSPPGGPIEIALRADVVEIVVSVRDQGPGIPSPDVERVFERFYRLDGSDAQAAYGHGLGLYVCRRLVEAQGGRIWVENHPAGGAVFSFALPVAHPDAGRTAGEGS
ncbi:MAG: PAS domain-containing sensor histidine kinase [Thermoleophilia bacterium]|nr:PAS domain-containing sensor histidine kinase [Thermoleophilia bacterium]